MTPEPPSTAIDRQDSSPPLSDVSPGTVRLMGLMFLALAALLAYFLTAFWPVKAQDDKDWSPVVTLFGTWSFAIATEIRLIWLVVISAALGSYVHTVTSFASYVGNRTLHSNWLWWYVLRTPIGIALATVFYFVIRAGLFSSAALGQDISPFGVAALSGMVGMFSKQATDKLREIFDNLFRTAPGKGDDVREDKLTAAQPTIETIDPSAIEMGAATTVVIRGKGFSDASSIAVNGLPRATMFRSNGELSATLTSEDVAAAGTLEITVRHPGPPETISNMVRLVVREPEKRALDRP